MRQVKIRLTCFSDVTSLNKIGIALKYIPNFTIGLKPVSSITDAMKIKVTLITKFVNCEFK